MLVYVFALAAAFLFAFGSVIQQHAAAQAPPQDVMSLRLLWWLVRRRLWLLGLATTAVGNVFSATALGRGGVTIVEPLLSTRLLFVLPMMGFWVRRGPARRDVVAAAVTAIGLSMFIVAGQPSVPTASAADSDLRWVLGGGLVVGVAVVTALAGRRLHALRRAPLLAGAAGLLFGLQATLTSDADRLVGHPVALLTSWLPYAVVVVAVLATLFLQSAYEMAPLPSSFPAGATTEPITGVVLGVTVLGGSIRLGPGELALEVFGLLLMLAGIYVLARSPLVLGELVRVRIRDEEAEAYQRERDLVRSLEGLENMLDRIHASPRPAVASRRDQQRLHAELAHVDRELVRLAAILRDLERLHRRPPVARPAASFAPLDIGANAEELERLLRSRARELTARSVGLSVRARALLAPAG